MNTLQGEAVAVNGIKNLVNFFIEILDKEDIGMGAKPSFKFVFNFNKFLVKKILLGHKTFQIIFIHNIIFLVCYKVSEKPGSPGGYPGHFESKPIKFKIKI